MKKVIVVVCLILMYSSVVLAQKKVKINCKQNLENIFKIQEYKYKYDIVQFIYKYRNGGMFFKNDFFLNYYFKFIKGYSYFEEKEKVWERGIVRLPISDEQKTIEKVEWMSEEEIKRYLDHLNCTPEDMLISYISAIQDIKLEKKMYLKCIDEAITKRSKSKKYAKNPISYFFKPPHESLSPPQVSELDFLKIFKEFIFNRDEDVLPDGLIAYEFLKSIRKTNLMVE